MTLKKLVIVSALAFSMQASIAAPVQFVDRVAAVVENQVITLNEFNMELAQAKARAPKGQAPSEKEVMQGLIDKALLLTVADRNGITVSDAEVDESLMQIGKANKLTIEQVYQKVGKESGFSKTAVRREIANGIKVNKVSEREVLSRAQASDAEINQLVASGQVKLPAGIDTKMTQYDTRHILIPIDQATPEPLARKKIAELQARLKAGEAFDSLARTYSQDPGSAANGGSLGWVPAGVMVPEFDKAMLTQPVGVVSSQPVRTVFGYHLVKVDGKRQVEAKDEALRQQAKQMIINQRAGQIYQEMMQQLRKDAHIEVRM